MIQLKRQATWMLIGLVLVIEGAYLLAWSRLVFHPRVLSVLVPLHQATHGLVGPNLVFGLLGLLLTVGIFIFTLGRVPPAAVGWSGRKLGVGLLVGAGLWLTMQVVLAAMARATGHDLTLAPGWQGVGTFALLGSLVGQLFGITLHEETVYRGFLFPQLGARLEGAGARGQLLAGALLSQLLFAASHVPNLALVRHAHGAGLALDLLGVFLLGLAFVLVYVVTGNLFVCIALHTLGNQPAALLPADDTTVHIVLGVLAILLLLAWRPAGRLLRVGSIAPAAPAAPPGEEARAPMPH